MLSASQGENKLVPVLNFRKGHHADSQTGLGPAVWVSHNQPADASEITSDTKTSRYTKTNFIT